MTSEEECIRALQAAADQLGESPTKAAYEDLGLTPASATIHTDCCSLLPVSSTSVGRLPVNSYNSPYQRVMGSWNEAKEAAGLATNTSTGSRVGPKPDGVDLPEGLEWADLSQDQRWHYRNREWNRERTLDRRARHRAWVYERKRESEGCTRCSETDPALSPPRGR